VEEAAAEAVPAAVEEEDNIMKKNLYRIMLIPFMAVALSGCYTVMWMPDQSSSDYQDEQNQNDYYYPETNYGDYYNFYDSPWWYTAIDQNSGSNPYIRDTNKSTEFLRNAGDRGRSPSRGGGLTVPPSTTRPEPILTTSPSATTNPDNNTGTKVENSNTTGSSSNTTNRNSNNNNNRPARNDNGRNSNGRN